MWLIKLRLWHSGVSLNYFSYFSQTRYLYSTINYSVSFITVNITNFWYQYVKCHFCCYNIINTDKWNSWLLQYTGLRHIKHGSGDSIHSGKSSWHDLIRLSRSKTRELGSEVESPSCVHSSVQCPKGSGTFLTLLEAGNRWKATSVGHFIAKLQQVYFGKISKISWGKAKDYYLF